MGKGSGAGLGILLLAVLFLMKPKKTSFQPGGYEYYSRTHIMPHERVIVEREIQEPMAQVSTLWPKYPQVSKQHPRIPPTTVDYEEALASKYPDELEATRVAYHATRKVLGLREYTAPPMPRTSRGRR